MAIVIPLWFQEFGAAMYLIASVIGVLLAYYSFKLKNYTGERRHSLIHSGFIFVTAGFAFLLFANFYTLFAFSSCEPNCAVRIEEGVFPLVKAANYGYYFTSLVGYILIALSYTKINVFGRKLWSFAPIVSISIIPHDTIVFYPFASSLLQPFHILSTILLVYILFRVLSTYSKKRSDLTKFVIAGFGSMVLYHLLMFITPFSPTFFAVAHIALLVGFGSLLAMLVRVVRK